MAVNDLTFEQIATIMNNILQQATGSNQTLTIVNTSDFVTAGQIALKTGYDALSTAISQVLSRTIFSVRPYSARFKGMEVSEQRYGNIVRKLHTVDQSLEEDDRFKLVNGSSVDPWVVKKPKILQENFYGNTVVQQQLTIYRDQLDACFQSPDGMNSFIGMVMQNASDQLEQAREDAKRAALVNLIGAIIGNYAQQNVKLVTMYNAFTGGSDTYATICADSEKYQQFMRFAYATVAKYCSMMTERSALFHANIGSDYVMKHTPYADQRVYMIADQRYNMDAMVLADAYHDNYLRYADTETVNFWQNIANPTGIDVTPSYLVTTGNNAGTIATGTEVNTDAVFAVVMDRDAAGMTQANEWADTMWNARGGYTNWFFHTTNRYWNSFFENAIVFTLD